MYQDHFHFKQEPFSIAPDPSFLYPSRAHKEALAHLMYGFSHGGFVLVTGEVGTGKTTLLRNLLKQTPKDLDVAFILNPRLTVRELLETLCEELGVHYDPHATQTVKAYIDALNKHLLRTHQLGRSTVVIIDEAQNLSPAVLEQVRLLTNLETDEKKLMRIILVGQPELSDLLDRQELRQLAQRITARYHLGSLSREDAYAYVAHRLSRAGGHPELFTRAALRKLFGLSKGIPRIINVIADRALLGAYAQGKMRVNAATVARAAREVLGRTSPLPLWTLAAAGVLALSLLLLLYFGTPATPKSPDPVSGGSAAKQDQIQQTDELLSAAAPALAQSARAESADADFNPRAGSEPTSEPASAPEAASAESGDAAGANLQLIRSQSSQTGVQTQSSSSQTLSPQPAASLPGSMAGSEDSAAGLPETVVPRRPPGNPYEAQRQAYAAVFARWGAEYSSEVETIPCDFAPSAGLQCLSQYGSWDNIEQTDLPVVLELWDDQAAPYHAALTVMRDSELTLTVGKDQLRTTLRGLRDIWYGAYVVLWQTPPGYRGSLRLGDTHETVGWLRQQLSGVSEILLSSPEPNYFDQSLHDAVVAFQRQEGLIIDGVVGPATWIRLSNQLRLPAPRLSS